MAINFEKGLLKVDQLIGEELSQHLIEGELIIPESKPEIARILDVELGFTALAKKLSRIR